MPHLVSAVVFTIRSVLSQISSLFFLQTSSFFFLKTLDDLEEQGYGLNHTIFQLKSQWLKSSFSDEQIGVAGSCLLLYTSSTGT